MKKFSWNAEGRFSENTTYQWRGCSANQVLDFHGRPDADLVVFSDGNHHMALEASLESFYQKSIGEGKPVDIFYVTLPPPVLLQFIKSGGVTLANLTLNIKPDAIIGPAKFVTSASSLIPLVPAVQFARSRGNSFLLRKQYAGLVDSFRSIVDQRLSCFISNPKTETASYEIYSATLKRMALAESFSEQEFEAWVQPEAGNLVIGEHVHHREVPEALYADIAQVSLLYHHLASHYARIYPDDFVCVPLYGAGSEAPDALQTRSEYNISRVDNDNQHAESLMEFFSGPVVAEIYAGFELAPVQTAA